MADLTRSPEMARRSDSDAPAEQAKGGANKHGRESGSHLGGLGISGEA